MRALTGAALIGYHHRLSVCSGKDNKDESAKGGSIARVRNHHLSNFLFWNKHENFFR